MTDLPQPTSSSSDFTIDPMEPTIKTLDLLDTPVVVPRELVIIGAGRSGRSMLEAMRLQRTMMDVRVLTEPMRVALAAAEVDKAVLNIDSFDEARKELMNPNAHEIPIRERTRLTEDDLTEIHDWGAEPAEQDNSFDSDRVRRFGNNKFKPSAEHKRKIKKLAAKAKQKQRRLKGK